MGLGNGNPKQGDRGSNHSYEFRTLQSLGAIAAFAGGGATEATLQLVLTAIQSGSEFEARLVEDSAGSPVTWLEVRTWNTSGGTWNPPLYYPPGSNTPGSPTLPVTYINNSSVLATIASNTIGLATEVTLASVDGKLNSLGQKASAGSVPVVLSTEQEAMIDGIETLLTSIDTALGGVATETTLLVTNTLLTTIDSVLDNILLDTTAIATDIGLIEGYLAPVVRSSALTRVAGVAAASVAAGARSVAFFNAGPVAATVAGGTLNPGEAIDFAAGGEQDTLAAIPYVTIATGDLVITTVI